MATPLSLSPNRYGLAIHTASSDLGFAISNFAEDSRCQTWALGREVSNYLHLYLHKFIQPQTWQDLEFTAVAKGPGGFTGTRLGVVTARTLAQQLNVPLFAISTLAAVAWQESVALNSENPETNSLIAVQMAAQRGEVHGAIYQITHEPDQASITALLPDSVMSLEQWQQTLANWNHPYRLVQAEGGLGKTAEAILQLAYLEWQLGERPHWSEALPFYGQSPV